MHVQVQESGRNETPGGFYDDGARGCVVHHATLRNKEVGNAVAAGGGIEDASAADDQGLVHPPRISNDGKKARLKVPTMGKKCVAGRDRL